MEVCVVFFLCTIPVFIVEPHRMESVVVNGLTKKRIHFQDMFERIMGRF